MHPLITKAFNMACNILYVVIFYQFWFITQGFLETDSYSNTTIIDRTHTFIPFQYINELLNGNIYFAKFSIMITTLMIDINIVYYFYRFLFHNEKKTILILMCGTILRQLCQYINRLPMPENMIWFDPGFPTVIMNYSVANDFFFSGHTLTALIFGIEMIKSEKWYIKCYSVVYMSCEIIFILASRAHYFMDVYAAFCTYFMINYFYDLTCVWLSKLPTIVKQ